MNKANLTNKIDRIYRKVRRKLAPTQVLSLLALLAISALGAYLSVRALDLLVDGSVPITLIKEIQLQLGGIE